MTGTVGFYSFPTHLKSFFVNVFFSWWACWYVAIPLTFQPSGECGIRRCSLLLVCSPTILAGWMPSCGFHSLLLNLDTVFSPSTPNTTLCSCIVDKFNMLWVTSHTFRGGKNQYWKSVLTFLYILLGWISALSASDYKTCLLRISTGHLTSQNTTCSYCKCFYKFWNSGYSLMWVYCLKIVIFHRSCNHFDSSENYSYENSSWGWNDKRKRDEMTEDKAR